MNWANIDIGSSNSDDNNKSDDDGGANWGSDDDGLADNWESAPDPEEVARKKKEEEERIEREKKEAAEAEKKRKQEIREEKIRRKKLLEAVDDFDDDFFDVDVTKEQKEIADLHNALDALGELDMNTTDPNKIDIGLYKPETVVQFGAFAEAIKKKFNQIFPEIEQGDKTKKEFEKLKSEQEVKKVKMIEYLITALCDSYKSAFIADLNKSIIELYNKKLNEAKKEQGYKKRNKQQSGAFYNANKKDDDIDDFM